MPLKVAIIALATEYKNRRIIAQRHKKSVPKSERYRYDAFHFDGISENLLKPMGLIPSRSSNTRNTYDC